MRKNLPFNLIGTTCLYNITEVTSKNENRFAHIKNIFLCFITVCVKIVKRTIQNEPGSIMCVCSSNFCHMETIVRTPLKKIIVTRMQW